MGIHSERLLLLCVGGENQWQILCVYMYCRMFPVMRPYISWFKICNSINGAVEDKALDKQYEATRSVLTSRDK